jgi:hypothetical protein
VDSAETTVGRNNEEKREPEDLYDLSDEMSLATDLIDILDELKIISVVISEQKEVAKDIERAFWSKGEPGEEEVGEGNAGKKDAGKKEVEIGSRIDKVERTVERLRLSAEHEYTQVRNQLYYPQNLTFLTLLTAEGSSRSQIGPFKYGRDQINHRARKDYVDLHCCDYYLRSPPTLYFYSA